jgi:hypothetical protein
MAFKKNIFILTAFLVLAGILNCAVIEPVFACHENEAECQTGADDHSCYICHSLHHQWLLAGDSVLSSDLRQQKNFLKDVSTGALEPPLRPIFHPPVYA